MSQLLADAAFVINLDSRPDRWEKMQGSLRRAGVHAERFAALTPARLVNDPPPEALREFLAVTDGPRADAEHKLQATWACLHSHLAVIQKAKEARCRAVLIMEDDCEFMPYAKTLLALVAQQIATTAWGLFYLGGTLKKGGINRRQARNVRQVSRVRLAHAYVVHCSVYDRILQEAPISGLPLDWYYSECLSQDVPTFMISPVIARQRLEDVSSIESVKRVKKFKFRKTLAHWLAMIRYGGLFS